MSDQEKLRILYVCDDDAIRFKHEPMLQEAEFEITWLPSNGDFGAANIRSFNAAILGQSVHWKRAAFLSRRFRRLHPTIKILRINTLRSEMEDGFEIDCEIVAGPEVLIQILESLNKRRRKRAQLGKTSHGPSIEIGSSGGSAEKLMSIRPKILIADDEPVIADTLAMILNQGGFEARAVYSGESALEMAATFAPHMLVTDVIMAELNGIETAILMRKILPQIKILLFSGQASSNDLLLQARAQGYDFEILAKPIHPKDLIRKLQDSGVSPAIKKASDAQWSAARRRWIDASPSGYAVDEVGRSSKETA